MWSLLAVLLVLLGLALEGWAVFFLGWRRAADLGTEPPDPVLPRLVFGGPFGRVRHPQSLGLLLLLAAAAAYWRTPGICLVAMLAGALVIGVALRDERACATRFGEAHARYRRAVPFLVPRIRR